MAYEKVSDLSVDTVIKIGGIDSKTGKQNAKQMEGYYLGNKTVPTANGPAVIHVFQTAAGNQGAWGTKDLNDKLAQIPVGTMTLVDYLGKKKLTGGKTKHSYDVQKDPENTIKVAALVQPQAQESFDDSSEEEYAEESQDDGQEDELQAAALQAAERKAKMQALLNSRNKGKN